MYFDEIHVSIQQVLDKIINVAESWIKKGMANIKTVSGIRLLEFKTLVVLVI